MIPLNVLRVWREKISLNEFSVCGHWGRSPRCLKSPSRLLNIWSKKYLRVYQMSSALTLFIFFFWYGCDYSLNKTADRNECVLVGRSLQGSDSIFWVMGWGQNELFFKLVNMWQMTVQELLIPITVIQCFIVKTDSGLQITCKLNSKPLCNMLQPGSIFKNMCVSIHLQFE